MVKMICYSFYFIFFLSMDTSGIYADIKVNPQIVVCIESETNNENENHDSNSIMNSKSYCIILHNKIDGRFCYVCLNGKVNKYKWSRKEWIHCKIKKSEKYRLTDYLISVDIDKCVYQELDDIDIEEIIIMQNDIAYYYDSNGIVIYSGGYKVENNVSIIHEGYGKEYRNENLYYEGNWKNNVPNGAGKLFNEDGSVKIEGNWSKGIISLTDDIYSYTDEETRRQKTVRRWIWSEVIVGLGIVYFSLLYFPLYCHIESLLWNLLDPGLFYLECLILQQFNNSFCRGLTIVLMIIYCIYPTGYYLLLSLIYWRYTSNVLLVIFLKCSEIFPIVSSIVILNVRKWYIQIDENVFTIIRKKKRGYLILIDIGIGIIMIVQCGFFLICNKEEDPVLYLGGILFIIDSVMYFILSYLHSHNGKLFAKGKTIGIIWGIVSCIFAGLMVALFILNYYKNYYSFHFIVLFCYTWFISLSSYLL